jgi:uncharacterized protein YjiS (DUF1127 family)
MAFYINKTGQSVFAKGLARTKTVFAGLLSARNRSADVARLQNLSDDDLGRIGLTRHDIMRHVYRDIYYV